MSSDVKLESSDAILSNCEGNPMTLKSTNLDAARHAAQALHRTVSANLEDLRATTEEDLTTAREAAKKLAILLKSSITAEGEALKSDVRAAAVQLDTAEQRVKDNIETGKDRLKQANLALLEGAHVATQSLSHAVAALRGRTIVVPRKSVQVAS